MPTKCTVEQLLNPKGRKAWREDCPTRGQDLWEMHGVWEWDRAKNAGAVLREKYLVSDPTTGRKVRCIFIRHRLARARERLHLRYYRSTGTRIFITHP
jgi:hypothetical protein